MPNCSVCNKVQAQLNKGALCKQCFSNKINKVHLNEETGYNNIDTNSTSIEEDRSIIDIIKDHMSRESNWNNETQQILKDQIIYLKAEMTHKNNVIESLIKNQLPLQCNTTTANNNTNNTVNKDSLLNNNESMIENISIMSDSSNIMESDEYQPIISDYMKWQPVKRKHTKNKFARTTADQYINYHNKYNVLNIEENKKQDDMENNDFSQMNNNHIIMNGNYNNRRRPNTIINESPEKDIIKYSKVVPGNTSYAERTHRGKKLSC